MSASDLAIVAALIFVWGSLSARLERFDVTAPILFVLAGVLLTHGPLATLGFVPSNELVKSLAEVTLVLVLFSDASRVGLRDLRADLGRCLRLLGIGLPLTIGLGTLLAYATSSARIGGRCWPPHRPRIATRAGHASSETGGAARVRRPSTREDLDDRDRTPAAVALTGVRHRQPPRYGHAWVSELTWIPGGTFGMGSADFYPEERPVHGSP